MSRENVRQSLSAVERALEHFVSSLDRAGFREGAAAYRQMADVVLGQWIWVEQSGIRGLDGNFLRIAGLAGTVAERLRPYVGVMDRLCGLRGLAAEAQGIEPGSADERIVEALLSAEGGLTRSELRRATGLSTVALRAGLETLLGKGIVGPKAGRGRFALIRAEG